MMIRSLLWLSATVLVAGLILGFVLPWWILALVGAAGAWLLKTPPSAAWIGGFVGGALVWGGLAFWIDNGNSGILSGMIAGLAGAESRYAILLATAVFGALLASFGALTGSLARRAIA